MHANIDTLLAFNREETASRESPQESLFGGIESNVHALVLQDAPHATTMQKLTWEKDLLGVYVSGHPLDAHLEELKKRPTIKRIKEDGRNGIPVVTAGMVETVRELLTKKGDRMAFVGLVNHTDAIEMTAFPEVYRANLEYLKPGSCVAVKGTLNIRSGEPTILVDKVKLLTKELTEATETPTVPTETVS